MSKFMHISATKLRMLLWALLLTASTYPLGAQECLTSRPMGWLDRATLTGDWAGVRTTLERAGIGLRAGFLTESTANPVGGQRQSARYTQEVNFGADLDLSRLIHDQGATIQITFNDRVGRSLSADAIGNLFAVQQLYGAGQNFRIAELNYQQTLFANKLNFELGWSLAGDYLASLPVFCDFQNGFICGHPSPMTTNSGANNYPVGQWGARVRVNPTRRLYAQAGLYQVNPKAKDSDEGFDLGFSGTGILVPVEFGWLPGNPQTTLAGTYKLGAYYNSSKTPDVLTDLNGLSAGLTGAPFMEHTARFGEYVIGDQVIERDSSNPQRLLRVGVIAGIADRATATYQYFVAAGGIREGTFRHRDVDFVSVLFAHGSINPRLTRYQEDRNTVAPGSVGIQTYESIGEIDYNIQIAPWLSVRPNLQYIMRPGATGSIPNAVVIGLHTGVTF
ncbi:carbohydrate porin [Edaphobacter sp. HDX4]|uniref:carbohydrate porin n=1 Tax=Edaphobacter sp. HDX4 TaxID=2794064 RepID=UPI002FE61DC0